MTWCSMNTAKDNENHRRTLCAHWLHDVHYDYIKEGTQRKSNLGKRCAFFSTYYENAVSCRSTTSISI